MNKKKVVAYARFSSTNQREESIFRQMDKIKEYCERNNLDLVEEYIDEAQSGTNDRRERFQDMMDDAVYGDWDFIVVYKMDRLSRNVSDAMHYKKRLNKQGIRILSVIEDFDETTPEGGFFNLITMGISEFYVKNLAREAFAGLMQNAKRAMHTGGTPPLGFDVTKEKKYIINEHEAVAVRMIFDMVLENYSYADIARRLNEEGYKSKFGKDFRGHFTDLLQNRKYIGEYVYNRSSKKGVDGTRNHHKSKPDSEIVRIANALPQIVDDKIFEEVQNLIRNRQHSKIRRGPKSKYLLSGLIVCENCGYKIGGHTVYGGRMKKPRIVYRCKTKNMDKCDTKPINSKYLDKMVIDLTGQLLKKDYSVKLKKVITAKLNNLKWASTKEVKRLEKEIEKNEKIIDEFNEKIYSSSRSVDLLLTEQLQEYVSLTNELKRMKGSLNEDIDSMQTIYKKDIMDIQRYYKNRIRDEKEDIRPVLHKMVKKIVQGNDEVDIVINLNAFLMYNINSPLSMIVKVDRDSLAKDPEYKVILKNLVS